MTKRLAALLVATALSAGAVLATSASAQAVPCGSGNFCVWTDANFQGLKIEHSGDDHWWEGDMAGHDSSWANHGISGPGVKDHVQVYFGPRAVGPCHHLSGPGRGGRLHRRRERPGRLAHLDHGLLNHRPPAVNAVRWA